MSRRYRSRLARKESKRIFRQSLLLFLVTGIIVLAGIVWGIPTIIRLAGVMGEIRSSNEPIEGSQNIPPYPPQLAIPYEATSSATISIVGYAQANSTVSLYNNGDTVSQVETSEEGEFVFEEVHLQTGENNFTATSKNSTNLESEPSRIHIVYHDNQAPVITITQPSQGAQFFGLDQQTIKVSGELDKPAQVFINDRFTIVSSDNKFSQDVRLESGTNKIKIKAIDRAGNEREEEIEVSFSE